MARLVGKNFTITPKITTFTSNGTFTADSMSTECHLLVVAGAGGSSTGGGGAGGFREFKSPVTPYTASPLEGATPITASVQGYPIVIGGGLVMIHLKEILVVVEDIMVVAITLLVVVEVLEVLVVTKFQMDLATIGML
jgi:hypothetical protein